MENEGLPVRREECHQAGRDAGQEQTALGHTSSLFVLHMKVYAPDR